MKKLSKEEIEKLADEYATEQNSAYTNDFYSFIAGINKAFELCEVGKSVKEKYKPTFEEWKKDNLVETNGLGYVYKNKQYRVGEMIFKYKEMIKVKP